MTKPILFNNRDGNSLYFNGKGLADSGPRNLLPLNLAILSSGDLVSVAGADITDNGFVDSPAMLLSGEIDDTAVAAGSYHIEWSATGTDESFSTDLRETQVYNGMTLDAGAWVYLEATSSRDIGINWVAYNAAGTVSDTGTIDYTTVETETWTYITMSDTIAAAGSVYASLVIEANGNQSVGDELYIGALFLGVDGTSWAAPTTPDNDILTLEFTARILGAGTLLATESSPDFTESGFHIEAVDQGFMVRVATYDTANAVTTRDYTTATNIYTYGSLSTFKWVHNRSTGLHSFYEIGPKGFKLIDSGSVATTTDRFVTSYGFETPSTGYTAGVNGTYAFLSYLRMEDQTGFGWEASSFDSNLDILDAITGSEVDLDQVPSETQTNQSFHATDNGWITFADATEQNALVVDYVAGHKFGTGDYTYAQSLRAVGNSGSRAVFDDGKTVFRAPVSAGNSVVESGATSLTLSRNVFDGERLNYLVERESGVALNFYDNDFSVVSDTVSDGGDDLTNTNDLWIGYNGTDYMSMIAGVTVTFNRLLEDFEKLELEDWLKSGYSVDSEPDWLRDAAGLYLNPTDPVQEAEWASNGRLINLAVELPTELYVRYKLSSTDGVSNPQLTSNVLRIGNLEVHETGEEPGYDTGPVQTVHTGYKQAPLLAWSFSDSTGRINVPQAALPNKWTESDWTLACWVQFNGDSSDLDNYTIIGQGDSLDANSWILQYNTTAGNLELLLNGTAQLAATNSLDEKLYSVVVTHTSAGALVMYIDAVSADTGTAGTIDSDRPLEIGGVGSDRNFNGIVSEVVILERVLTSTEVATLHNLGPKSLDTNFTESVTITDSVTTSTYNWGTI